MMRLNKAGLQMLGDMTPAQQLAEYHRLLELYRRHGSISAAFKASGRTERLMSKVVKWGQRQGIDTTPYADKPAVAEAPRIAPQPHVTDLSELRALIERLEAERAQPELATMAAKVVLEEPEAPQPDEPSHLSFKEEEEFARVEFRIGHRIRTVEEALEYAEVDTAVWRVKEFTCTYWETGMKLREFNDKGKVKYERPHQTQQWKVSIRLERILPKSVHDATAAVFEAMKGYEPKWPVLPKRATPKVPHLAVIDLCDAHLGKLCWSPEVQSENYDLAIAEQVYRNAVIDLLNECAAYEIDHFLFPLGNDFFHVDGFTNQTTAGTPQDVDGRLAKILEVGERAVIWAIEQLVPIAPVTVLHVEGNHDRLLSYCLARTISAWFRECKDVTVDTTPTSRKRFRYGTTLLGYTHGNEEKHASLPVIMATEWPGEWSQTTCREWHLGHRHTSKRTETTPVDTHDGVVVRTLMSLSGRDSWHARKGYLSNRAAEALVYRRDAGYVASFVARAR